LQRIGYSPQPLRGEKSKYRTSHVKEEGVGAVGETSGSVKWQVNIQGGVLRGMLAGVEGVVHKEEDA